MEINRSSKASDKPGATYEYPIFAMRQPLRAWRPEDDEVPPEMPPVKRMYKDPVTGLLVTRVER